ncbi:hypothetical protein DW322_03430 [Rhodococcus rhodnii]|uniref:DNA helicase DnaB-like N-terminal domain-containing protein n=2 Tax=Rhodococcus rhodnii TaxID=38312 RepID=R7WHH7_9NOCA|nr:hypothetical protein [Rhodococcus rhodnii]EOM74620.1 hypothetical protein Rrhod_4095 [Rhodococcus rhodnii LMG 5362]TXG89454.1 hypothetical protein DW322_03430 [Rhodococcus rhodnii]
MTTTLGHDDVRLTDRANPDAAALLVGALIAASRESVCSVLEHVADNDVEHPGYRRLLRTIRHLTKQGRPHGTVCVADELTRTGQMTPDARRALIDATTAGAEPLALRGYAAAVVADAYRWQYELAGKSLVEAAHSWPEHELVGYLRGLGTTLVAHDRRLGALRGEKA